MPSPSRPRQSRRPSESRNRRQSSSRDDPYSPSTPQRKKRPRPVQADSGTEDERAYLRDGLGESPRDSPRRNRNGESPRDSPRRNRDYDRERDRRRSKGAAAGGGASVKIEKSRGPPRTRESEDGRDRRKSGHKAGSSSTSQLLSEDALKMLDHVNEKGDTVLLGKASKPKAKGKTRALGSSIVKKIRVDERRRKKKRRRVVSGPILEEGRVRRERRKGKRFGTKFWIFVGVFVGILIIAIGVGVAVAKKKKGSSSSSAGASTAGDPTAKPPRTELNGISENSIPASAKGTILDPFTWYDTADFNVTYTDVKVGGLPIMGLNSSWDDTTQANPNAPKLNQPWPYPKTPIRGVNLGGWLSIEPFITPSLFNKYAASLNIVDEYTLTQHLGSGPAATTLETHYATFVTEDTFKEIAAAGLDHVRIPYSYWAVTTYPGDPYVPQISWRYLLRGIEWARKYGLRVNLDIHGLPGSQNGWNHSGRWGPIGWLNGTNGDLNAQRSIDIHDQLSTFFAQSRYSNIITIYGLVNEPAMVKLEVDKVLNWTSTVKDKVKQNGINATIAIGDGFLGLEKWAGLLPDSGGMVLDVHQYVIFNVQQVIWNHTTKINYACSSWSNQMVQSMNTATGFGAILCGEWSQADTDCATYLNNVNVGSRWEGTFDQGEYGFPPVLSPLCPTSQTPSTGSTTTAAGGKCSCSNANADPSTYSATYKQWLLMFAEAQMHSFEQGWGWFYWVWDAEDAVQWSYKKGLANGILPAKAYAPTFKCDSAVPDYGALGLQENY